MIKALLIIMLPVLVMAQDAVETIAEFGGLVTTIIPEKIGNKYSPDLLNVYTDDGGMITKRRGTVKHNTVPVSGSPPIRNMFVYPFNPITSYLTVNSSNSWSYILNGVPTTIVNGLTISAYDDYTTANNVLYRDNGVDAFGGKWDGTTYTPFDVPTLSSISVISVQLSTTVLATAVGTSSTSANNSFTAWYTPTILKVSLDTDSTNFYHCNVAITGYNQRGTLTREVVVSTVGMETATVNYFYSVSTITWYSLESGWANKKNIVCNVGKYGYSMMSGRYIKWWNVRMWKVPANSSIVYYSNVNAPEDFNRSYNYVLVNVNDGDIITGMMIWGDRLLVTKKYAVYEIYESQPGVFLVRRLYNGIGCLYSTTMDVLPNGLPVWMSHRGVEEFTGNSFNLLSESNDEYFKSLPQLGDAVLSYTDSTKAQFAAGTSIEISTTQVVDSLTVRTSTEINQTAGVGAQHERTSGAWQEFKASYTAVLWGINISLYQNSNSDTFTLSSGNIVGAGFTVNSPAITSGQPYFLDFSAFGITLSSGVSYRITKNGAGAEIWHAATDVYARGETSFAGDWQFDVYMVRPTSAAYISSIIDFNSLGLNVWTSWNSFNVSCNIPAGVGYYVRTSTASSIINQSPYVNVGNGALINLTTGPFIQYRIETTSSSMQIDDVTIAANGEASKPAGKVFDRRYWLAVTTNTSTWSNSVILCYQKNGEWTQFNNMNVSCMAVMKNELYYGDSTATGNIFKTDVAGIWQDNGFNYNSYWRSKLYDANTPMADKEYKTLWVQATPNGTNNMAIRYAVNGVNSWIEKTISLNQPGIPVQKITIDAWLKGHSIQLEVGENDSHGWSIRRIDLLYKVLQPE